uniref:Uncharacterized protein n=1 Tax=Anguilla anguilla TaxID=7936 RepID=A0A0E9PKA5_ANGAN
MIFSELALLRVKCQSTLCLLAL